jgi:hypothetical protein
MKRLLLLGGLLLASCSTTQQNQANAIVTEVEAITQQVCAFIPTAETILSIVALGIPLLATAEGIADAICHAVTAKKGVKGKFAIATVHGVRVQGHFIH